MIESLHRFGFIKGSLEISFEDCSRDNITEIQLVLTTKGHMTIPNARKDSVQTLLQLNSKQTFEIQNLDDVHIRFSACTNCSAYHYQANFDEKMFSNFRIFDIQLRALDGSSTAIKIKMQYVSHDGDNLKMSDYDPTTSILKKRANFLCCQQFLCQFIFFSIQHPPLLLFNLSMIIVINFRK